MRHQHRIALILGSLAVATLLTARLVHQQTAVLAGARTVDTRAVKRAANSPAALVPMSTSPAAADGIGSATPDGSTASATNAGLIDHARFFYDPDFDTADIEAFLQAQAGPLKQLQATIGNRDHSFAEILSSQTALYSINPKVVLTLIEQQSGMLSAAAPTDAQLQWMLGFHGEDEARTGWMAQLRWAIRELHRAQRDFPAAPELVYADQSRSPVPAGMNVAEYAIARVLAQTTTPAELPQKLHQGNRSFVATYTRLFGDPRAPIGPTPPGAPFLSLPMGGSYDTQSFFDHDSPFLQPTAAMVTYRGDRTATMPYDGHDGWDYGMQPPDPILAAADGTVLFAGNSDDGCGIARAVIIDHGNGYRTLYWHLTEPSVATGQRVRRGEQIGIVGASGCVTGPHLHFQVQYLGRDVDPYGWCGVGDDPWALHPAGQRSTWLWRDQPSPCAVPDTAIVVDTTDPGFRRLGGGWTDVADGIGGSALHVPSRQQGSSSFTVGIWRPQLQRPGTYRVLAWIPYHLNGLNDTSDVQYLVGHADGSGDTHERSISQKHTANGWADLGTWTFDPARTPFVGLVAESAETGTNIWYDAVVWIPVEQP